VEEIIEQYKAKTAEQDVVIHELRQQLADLPTLNTTIEKQTALLTQATAALNEANAKAEAYEKDNSALRQSLANYMLSTDGGQAALREFAVMALDSQIAALNAERQRIAPAAE